MIWEKAVALISGGANGLGKRLALNILSKGGKVIVADIDKEAGVRLANEVSLKYGKDCIKFMKCDVSDTKELHQTLQDGKDHFGRLDILCNNAAIMSPDIQLASKQVSINLTAVIEGTYKGIELMSKRNGEDGGTIVNIASGSGYNLMRGTAVYAATKHGVVAFSRSFKLESNYHDDGVRVNCICPFFLDTEMLRQGVEEIPEVEKQLNVFGYASMENVEHAFVSCVENSKLNGAVIAVHAPDRIYQLKFIPPVEKM